MPIKTFTKHNNMTNTMTLTCKGKPNIEITQEQLEQSLQIGIVCSKTWGMNHRVFAVVIDNNHYTVAMRIDGQAVNMERKHLNTNGNLITVPKKSIEYWG